MTHPQELFNPNLFVGKRFLITGGGTGLGKSMALRLSSLGATLEICGRRKEVLQQTAQEINQITHQPVHAHVCDIRKPEEIEGILNEIFSQGPVHGLINNAAGNFLSRTEDLSTRAMDSVLNIVLHGTAYMTLACGKRWLQNNAPASVLSIVTTYAWCGSAYVVPSAMAKAGVLALTQSLAVEWGDRGIRLNAIAPGPFPTEGAWERLVPVPKIEKAWKNRIPLQRTGDHLELANLACYLLSEHSAYINGEVVTIDGGEWLQGAGQFSFLKNIMNSEDWEKLRSSRVMTPTKKS